MADKIYIAMSGGVDSSVAAAILKKQGYDCRGVFMITNDHADNDISDAKAVAQKLGINIDIVDFRLEFNDVLEYFCSEYKQGKTPNPCVYCNRNIKFGKLWQYAKSNGASFIATGHYIRSIPDSQSVRIYTAANLAKDQSYVLSMVPRDVIDHILLPVGNFSKDQIRQMASDLGLGIESKPDSQEICFIPDNNYVARLEQMCPEIRQEGSVVDSQGKVLGKHNGIHNYTIGQRRGLGIALGDPAYVVSLDARSNTVTLGSKAELMSKYLVAREVNWLIEKPLKSFRAKVKIRYNHSGSWAVVTPDGERAYVEFNESVSAVTPGQTAVFYIEDELGLRLAGGGWID